MENNIHKFCLENTRKLGKEMYKKGQLASQKEVTLNDVFQFETGIKEGERRERERCLKIIEKYFSLANIYHGKLALQELTQKIKDDGVRK